MIFYDGTYRIRGYGKSVSRSKWAYAWRIRIIDLSISQPEVKHLKPFIIVAAQTGEVVFRLNCAEALGKRICRDFNIDVREVIWVEYFSDKPKKMYVASFTPISWFGPEVFYAVRWRDILPNEFEVVKFFIPEAEHVCAD